MIALSFFLYFDSWLCTYFVVCNIKNHTCDKNISMYNSKGKKVISHDIKYINKVVYK